MNCADVEILICDYLDGTLAPDQKAELERHLSQCPACAELARDCGSAVRFIERTADLEPPPELITRILFDAPWTKSRKTGWRKWAGGLLSPILQPRFAMGMAMTILSLSILARYSPVKLDAADWRPSRIRAQVEDQVSYGWARTVKFYDNLKFVYQIQNTLSRWKQAEEEQQPRPEGETPAAADDRKLPVKSNRGSPGTAPSSNPTGGTR